MILVLLTSLVHLQRMEIVLYTSRSTFHVNDNISISYQLHMDFNFKLHLDFVIAVFQEVFLLVCDFGCCVSCVWIFFYL